MGYDIPTSEPTELTAGDSWQWDVSLTDYPPGDGWQLAYAIRGAEDLDAAWSSEISANGGTYEVRIAAGNTDLTPGNYRLIGFVTLSGERHIVYDAPLTVRANPVTTVNALSHDETMLAAIDALLEGRAQDVKEGFSIAGRDVRKLSPEELVRWQNIYRARVLQARNPGALTPVYEAEFHAPA